MEIAKWVILIALVGLVTWLLIDTIIMAVKKIKAKKQQKQQNDDNESTN